MNTRVSPTTVDMNAVNIINDTPRMELNSVKLRSFRRSDNRKPNRYEVAVHKENKSSHVRWRGFEQNCGRKAVACDMNRSSSLLDSFDFQESICLAVIARKRVITPLCRMLHDVMEPARVCGDFLDAFFVGFFERFRDKKRGNQIIAVRSDVVAVGWFEKSLEVFEGAF